LKEEFHFKAVMADRILITGSNGFTGKYVTDVFRQSGYSVTGLVRHTPGKDEIACDLMDARCVREVIRTVQPDGIIHLAALAFVKEDSPVSYYGVNIFGALHLLESLNLEGISPVKVIIAGSANVYGNPGEDAVDETHAPEPVNHYAVSKLAMEFMVKTWFTKMPILITRPFNYTGPGQDTRFLVPKIVDHFKRKVGIIELGNLNIIREFSDVRDVANIYLKLFESPAHSAVVNICTGKAYQLNDLLEMMEAIAGYSISVKQNPLYMRDNEIMVLRGSREKLASMISYQPRYTLPETLQDMFDA